MKCLTSVTFIFLLAWEGNPLILQNPIQKEESGLGEGIKSPKGRSVWKTKEFGDW